MDPLELPRSDAAKLRSTIIEELCQQCLVDVFEQANEDLETFIQQLGSAINIQHWYHPDKRKTMHWLPNDPYYLQNYARWKDFLLLEAQSMLSVSTQLTAFEFRSLILCRGDHILNELKHTALMQCREQLLGRFAERLFIPAELMVGLLEGHHKNNSGGELASFLPSETGLGFILRDRGGAAEEDLGIISFDCITNTREPDHMMKLLTLKSIFSRQLPKMPREYIARLTFDRHHYSFCLLKNGKVIGGVCFRPFFAKKFAEIVFLAVTSTEQVKGYGTRLMNHLKEFVRHRGIEYFLTYADNFALGYFRKQGFSQRISMPKDRWTGYIKDYDGGTLMECYICPHINYLQLGEIFINQRRQVHQAMRLIKTLTVYSGAAVWTSTQPRPPSAPKTEATIKDEKQEFTSNLPALEDRLQVDPATIPGFVEAGWTAELNVQRKKDPLPLNEQILKVIEVMSAHESAWPFRKPVSKQEAPDYHEHIKHPMDISTMRRNARNKVYKTKAEFGAHLKLMFDNCRFYNQASTIWYKLAEELEAAIWPKYLDIEET